MKSFWRSSGRSPKLRRRVRIGGTGVLAAAVVVSLVWQYEITKNDRLYAEALTQSQDQLASPHVAGEVVVGYKPTASDNTKQAHIDRHAGRLKKRNPKINLDVVTIARGDELSTLRDLKTSSDVAFAEPNYVRDATAMIPPDDPGYSKQWGYKSAGFERAWNITTGTNAPLVAVLDSGIDLTHPDLAAHIQAGGYDEVNLNNNPSDDNGHGTATAGIIAEVAGNGIGGVGGCWSCMILPVKVLDSQGHGSVSLVADGIIYAVDHGAKIINASLGGTTTSSAEVNAAAYAASKGVIIVASACEGQTTNPPAYYPASHPGVIGVGAVSQAGTLEPWSCWGPYVKISAPGSTYTTSINGGYNAAFFGTSASAPFVSAAVALLWAAHPLASRDEIISALLSGADSCCANTVGGRLDVARSLSLLDTSSTVFKKGDINKDGRVDVLDLSLLLAQWGTAASTSDLNGDGNTDVFDLSILIAGWTP